MLVKCNQALLTQLFRQPFYLSKRNDSSPCHMVQRPPSQTSEQPLSSSPPFYSLCNMELPNRLRMWVLIRVACRRFRESWNRILTKTDKRSALLLLSFVSFLPQLWLLYVRKDSVGLSLFFVLFNLIVATELFAFSFLLVVNCARDKSTGKPDIFVHDPRDVGDAINLAQFTLVWVLWLVM